MNYQLFFPFDWSTIDPLNDNIDVCIQLENGQSYTVVIATPTNIADLIKRDGVPYLRPCLPFLIAEKLNEEVVRECIADYLSEGDYYLSFYGES